MASSLQQRGETAVLGVGARPSRATPSTPAPTVGASIIGTTAESKQATTSSSGGIARRKLRRRENARLSSNPHIVRPSASDYALHHPNPHIASFPLPHHLQHLRLPSRPANAPSSRDDASSSSSSSSAGYFTMTFADAHYFLAHRVGIRPGQECPEGSMGVLQAFAKRAEAELQAWLHQDVFLAPDSQAATGSREALVDLNSQDDERDFRIFQVGKNAHNVVWEVPDAFLRLTVHCLARVLQCPTFSKDSLAGRQTWILNPRPGRGHVGVGLYRNSSLDTPPTTDIGTDVASEMASEVESEWAMSEIDEGEDLMLVERQEADDVEEDAVIVPYRIDEEDDSLADVEDEG